VFNPPLHAPLASLRPPSLHSHCGRPAALLVCKRWHARLFATPALWRQLEVAAPNLPADATAQWAAWETAAAQLLRRVSGFATAVQLDSRRRRQARWVTSALRLLQPAGIREVSLLAYQLPASPFALEPLRRLTQLTSLQLCCEGAQPAEADPIAGLIHLVPAPPLRSLRLEAHGLPQATLNALVQLSSLTDLQLVLRAGPLPHLQALTRLVRLRQLLVDDGSGYVPLHKVQLPAPADFAALERYAIRSLFTHTLVVRLGARCDAIETTALCSALLALGTCTAGAEACLASLSGACC